MDSWVHLKFHGGGNFDIILSSRTVQVNLKFHGIGIFIYLILVDSLKFHEGGNFDIILSSVSEAG